MRKTSLFSAFSAASCLRGTLLVGSLVASVSGAAWAQSLPARPQSGVDPDVQGAVDQAQQQLGNGQPQEAAQTLVGLYSATDRHTVAQRPQLSAQSQHILQEAGSQLQASGRLDAALLAQDAAWTISGRAPNQQYGQALAAMAAKVESTEAEQSLYFARRAQLADPGNTAAAEVEKRLSFNRFKLPGLVTLVGGSAIGVVGLGLTYYSMMTSTDLTYSQQTAIPTTRIVGISLLVVGALSAGTGAILLGKGMPPSAPVVPSGFPALSE